jgi:pimeloyl-ACP methyl ester carboxylesterase
MQPIWRTMIAATMLICAGCIAQQQVADQAAATPASLAIDEAMYVSIGGIEQWVTISGADRTNPVILVLHGGPGNPLSGVADGLFETWERDFTVVQWDQRGAGRTFSRNTPEAQSPLTVERMAQDGVELAEYLREHLRQRKVILFATSWGSVLGIHMAHARPDLFHAYVGHSQVVAWDANLTATYNRVLAMARAASDQTSIDTLTEIGPPPWSAIRNWPRFRRVYATYQRASTTAPPVTYVLNPAYASEQEQAQYAAAEDFSFEHLWGMTLAGPLTQVDLPALGTDFSVPIYVIQGENDLWTVPELARGYVDSISAPEKQFILVPGAGHDFSVNGMDAIRQVLLEHVRPRAVAP